MESLVKPAPIERRRGNRMLKTVNVQSGPSSSFLVAGQRTSGSPKSRGPRKPFPWRRPSSPPCERRGSPGSPLTRRLQHSRGGRRGRSGAESLLRVLQQAASTSPLTAEGHVAISGITCGSHGWTHRGLPRVAILTLSSIPSLNRKVKDIQQHPKHHQPCTSSTPAHVGKSRRCPC